eukprot:GDKI01018697.1.p1 GENE.GDKI01018697.1~~GDKI01018697.1.p1  ORF type:complete len:103 (+),score=6.84 GDKI01018697.1:197-505(+)
MVKGSMQCQLDVSYTLHTPTIIPYPIITGAKLKSYWNFYSTQEQCGDMCVAANTSCAIFTRKADGECVIYTQYTVETTGSTDSSQAYVFGKLKFSWSETNTL